MRLDDKTLLQQCIDAAETDERDAAIDPHLWPYVRRSLRSICELLLARVESDRPLSKEQQTWLDGAHAMLCSDDHIGWNA